MPTATYREGHCLAAVLAPAANDSRVVVLRHVKTRVDIQGGVLSVAGSARHTLTDIARVLGHSVEV